MELSKHASASKWNCNFVESSHTNAPGRAVRFPLAKDILEEPSLHPFTSNSFIHRSPSAVKSRKKRVRKSGGSES